MAGEDFDNQLSSSPLPSPEKFSDGKAAVDTQIIGDKRKEGEEDGYEGEDDLSDYEDGYEDSEDFNMEDTSTLSDASSTNRRRAHSVKKITTHNLTSQSYKNELRPMVMKKSKRKQREERFQILMEQNKRLIKALAGGYSESKETRRQKDEIQRMKREVQRMRHQRKMLFADLSSIVDPAYRAYVENERKLILSGGVPSDPKGFS